MEPIWIDSTTTEPVQKLLALSGVLREGERIVELALAGEGNMNVVLRAVLQSTSGDRSIIVKQSRPFVAKYEQIPAPIDRIAYEASFYDFVGGNDALASRMPKRLASNADHFLLVLEDLGPSSDATSWYNSAPNNIVEQVAGLLDWVFTLHNSSRGRVNHGQFGNQELRALNHAHIFDIPFQDPAVVDLNQVCPGLAEESSKFRRDDSLRSAALELGKKYCGSGNCLLHGDFYPGSWLVRGTSPMIIDPEFCFAGPAEFDLGVMLGHLDMIGNKLALQAFRSRLDRQSKVASELDLKLVHQFAAAEVIRRMLGVAQLPLEQMNLQARIELVRQAAETLLDG